ncbi:MAG: hypothetical protein D6713_02965 [Deltaproteobacteria bacterium]|nr:MAG: hypothetical protein D6713_02965 [Deltaproteobacteria bacterium]
MGGSGFGKVSTAWKEEGKMKKIRLFLLTVLVCLVTTTFFAAASFPSDDSPWPPTCTEEWVNDPAPQAILVCVPPNWNGDLILYAHGYVPPQYPLSLPEGELTFTLPDGSTVTMPGIVNSLGYAFATTSYRKNGYAVEQGGADILALYNLFADEVGPPKHAFITGGSEGGLIATMLLEKHPEMFDAGLALCGPIGGIQHEVNYLGDFRVVFDYFFPQIFDFGVADVPEDAWMKWDSYQKAIIAAMSSDPSAVDQLFRVTRAATDPNDPSSTVAVALHLLGYSIFATNDLQETAGGNPYGNRFRLYWGSDDDAALNRGVERVSADRRARKYLRRFYKPTGILARPLVALHTTMDDLVPFDHEIIYLFRTFLSGSRNLFTLIPVNRFGHCAFEPQEVFSAFALMVYRGTGELDPAFIQLLFGLGN